MKELFEFALLIVGVCTLVVLALGVISLPFAFLGFIILAAANVFTAGIVITYFGSLVVGIVASILIGLIS